MKRMGSDGEPPLALHRVLARVVENNGANSARETILHHNEPEETEKRKTNAGEILGKGSLVSHSKLNVAVLCGNLEHT